MTTSKPVQIKAKDIAVVQTFINTYMEKHDLKYQSYVDDEATVTKNYGKLVKAVQAQFSNVKMVLKIESAEYKPPFAPEWQLIIEGSKAIKGKK